MSSFDTLKRTLEATGFYSVEPNTPLSAELMTYADEIDRIEAEIDLLKREMFIVTAQDFGLTRNEKLYGREMYDLSTDDRRTILLNRLCITPSDHTVSSMAKVLTSCGLTHFNIYEQKNMEVLTVTGNGHIYSSTQRAWILSQLSQLMPAHLELYVFLNEINWLGLEARNKTWQELDEADLTWYQIDNLKEEE